MRKLYLAAVALLVASSSLVFGQDHLNLGVEGFVKPKANTTKNSKWFNGNPKAPAAHQGPCSVPLLKAEIPNDVDYVITEVKPPKDMVDRMPKAAMATVCESR